MSVIDEIAAERKRQIEEEGWTPEHDDKHGCGELADAAASYCLARPDHPRADMDDLVKTLWPWRARDWKPKDYLRNLVRAAALIVAEAERVQRLTRESPPEERT